MKKRKVVGGAVVLGLVVGAFFSGLFPGFGLGGSGNGNGDGSSVSIDASGTQTANNEQSADPPDNDTQADNDTKPVEGKEPPNAPELRSKLEVRIDDSSLLVRNGNGAGYREAEISEVVDLAKKTEGDDNGVRVLIQRRPNARVVTWSTLIQELKNAGLSSDSISMPKELVD